MSTADLLSSAETTESLYSLVTAATDQGLIDPERVRIIALGPRDDLCALSLFASAEWEKYKDFDSSEAIGEIGIAKWVLAQTASTRQAREELTTVARQALKAVAPRLAERFPPHVVLGGVEDGSLQVEAFCHPRGGETLMGLMEHRGVAKLYYPDVVLHAEGFTVFYPGGEVEGTSFAKADPAVLEFPFSDMTVTRETSDGVAFRMKSESKDRIFEPGHLREAVWPDKEAAALVLKRHLTLRPDLRFELGAFPPLDDTDAVERWFDNYVAGDLGYPGQVISDVYDSQGIDAARLFLERLPASTEGLGRVRARFGALLAQEKLWEEAWSIIAPVMGSGEEGWLYSLAPRVLLALGRAEEALAITEKMVEADSWLEQCNGRRMQALALVALGRDDEATSAARQAIEEHPNQSHGHYGLAAALQKADPAGALAAFETALAADRFDDDYVEVDFSDTGIRERHAFIQRLEEQQRQLKQAIEDSVVPTALEKRESTVSIDESRGWFRTAEIELEDFDRSDDLAVVAPGVAAVAAGSTGLVRVDAREPGAPAVSSLGAPKEGDRFHLKLVCVDQGIAYCIDGTEIRIARFGETLKWLGVQPSPSDENYQRIAVEGGVLALGSFHGKAYLYRVPKPGEIELAGGFTVPGYIQDFTLADGLLYIGDQHSLIVLDVRDPARPRVVSTLRHDDRDHRSNNIAKIGDLVFIRPGDHERGTWCIDVSDPAAPRSLGELPDHFTSLHDAGDRIIAATTNGRVFTLDPDTAESRNSAVYADQDEHPFEGGTLWHDGRFVVVYESSSLVEVNEKPREPWPLLELIDGAERPLREWVDRQLAELEMSPGELGAMRLYQSWTWVRMDLHPPEYPIRAGEGEGQSVSGELAEIYPAYPEDPEAPEEVNYKERRRWTGLAEARWRRVLSAVLAHVAETERFRELAAGTVHLFVEAGDTPRLLAQTYTDPSKLTSLPPLPETDLRFAPAKELLGHWAAWRFIETLEARVQSRPEDRADVLELAGEGNAYALRIASSLGLEDPEVFDAFIRAGGGREDVPSIVFKMLGRFSEHEQVKPILTAGFDSDDPATVLFAAKALGKLDTDRVTESIERLIEDDEEDLAVSALEQIEVARVRSFVPKLVERGDDWSEHVVPRVCALLLRVEHPEPLPQLYAIAAQAKQLEDDSWGLFDDDLEDGPKATEVEREFTARILVRRVADLSDSGADEPLWPPDHPQEESTIGWSKLMPRIMTKLHAAEQVAWFVDRLKKTADPGEDPDRAMVLPAIGACLEQADDYRDIAFALIDTVLAAPDDLFDKDERNKAERFRQWTGVHRAWELYHEGRLDDARALTDQRLESNPNDPDVLFIDARLIWVQDSVEACIARLKETLPRLGSAHRTGPWPSRAKLLNLYGCALDELQQYEEALPWFEKAQLADPDEASVMANLAEIHEKLGNDELAREWAGRAKVGGFENEVVLRLMCSG